ncbi:hypothetical protein EVA_22037 [gut metagenome]|uniref:Uncharacterized protein n=1 Tax=gut metagenome TaxID=749906 RepID=J9F5S7_9ZZZZ
MTQRNVVSFPSSLQPLPLFPRGLSTDTLTPSRALETLKGSFKPPHLLCFFSQHSSRIVFLLLKKPVSVPTMHSTALHFIPLLSFPFSQVHFTKPIRLTLPLRGQDG